MKVHGKTYRKSIRTVDRKTHWRKITVEGLELDAHKTFQDSPRSPKTSMYIFF